MICSAEIGSVALWGSGREDGCVWQFPGEGQSERVLSEKADPTAFGEVEHLGNHREMEFPTVPSATFGRSGVPAVRVRLTCCGRRSGYADSGIQKTDRRLYRGFLGEIRGFLEFIRQMAPLRHRKGLL